MHVEYAQLPPPEDSADRIFITDNAVVVLDGATAFVTTPVSAQTYADHLGRRLVDELTASGVVDLRDALASAIDRTSKNLELNAGESPSATVSVLRERGEGYDVMVLGDSPVIWGAEGTQSSLADGRLSLVAASTRSEYRARLRAGHGFDAHHHDLLRTIQVTQREHRNTDGGYWIAEADPVAAYHALVARAEPDELAWALIATDGAFDPLAHRGRTDWESIARYSSAKAAGLLNELDQWEATFDPHGIHCPRAKLHDDKTLCCVIA